MIGGRAVFGGTKKRVAQAARLPVAACGPDCVPNGQFVNAYGVAVFEQPLGDRSLAARFGITDYILGPRAL